VNESTGLEFISAAELMADPYGRRWPVVLETGERLTFEAACTQHGIDVSDVVCREGDWVVTARGLECLVTTYAIPAERLGEQWIAHMADKGWVKLDFLLAYYRACTHHRQGEADLPALCRLLGWQAA